MVCKALRILNFSYNVSFASVMVQHIDINYKLSPWYSFCVLFLQIARSLPRICFLSGLSGEEMMMFIDAFPETGTERSSSFSILRSQNLLKSKSILKVQKSCTLPYCRCANTMIYHHWIIINEIVITHSSLDNHQQNNYDHNTKIEQVRWNLFLSLSVPSTRVIPEINQNLVIDLASILLINKQ